MKILKNKNIAYELFNKSLPALNASYGNQGNGHAQYSVIQQQEISRSSGYNTFLRLYDFISRLDKASTLGETAILLNESLNNIISCSETVFFIYCEDKRDYIALNEPSKTILSFIESSFKDAVIEWLIQSGKPQTISDTISSSAGSNNYLLFHSREEGKKILTVSLISESKASKQLQKEIEVIEALYNIALLKIEKLFAEGETASVINELQAYQSKFSNDYKFSAIGELTAGIAEEILSPLQVIISLTDLIKQDDDEYIPESIKLQVKKVESHVSRLLKFADIDHGETKLYPLNINELISGYCNIISSTLEAEKYECVLSLDNNVPSILTNSIFMNQLFANVFFMIRGLGEKGGGIIVQSKYQNEKVALRFILTKELPELNADKVSVPEIMIIQNLMKKHEGEAEFFNQATGGSVISLSFPLKRKIRK